MLRGKTLQCLNSVIVQFTLDHRLDLQLETLQMGFFKARSECLQMEEKKCHWTTLQYGV